MCDVCIIIPGFGYTTIDSRILRLQPWNYLFQLSLDLKKNYNVCLIPMDTVFSSELFDQFNIIGLKTSNNIHICKHIFIPVAIGFLTKILRYIEKKRLGRQILYGVLTTPLMDLRILLRNYIVIKRTSTSIAVDSLLYENMLFRLKTKVINKKLYKIIVPSTDYKQILEERSIPEEKIVLYYPRISCDEKISKEKNDNDVFMLTYFGAFSEERGVISLLKAFRRIVDNHRINMVLQLLIRRIGSKNVQQYISLPELGQRIRLVHGDLPREKLHQFVSSSDIIILPYRIISSTVPLVFLESLLIYYDIPVLSTSIPGIKEHIVRYMPYELLLEPNYSVHELAEVILQVLNSNEILERISYMKKSYARRLCNVINSQSLSLL